MTALSARSSDARRFLSLTENCTHPIAGLTLADQDLNRVVSALSQHGFARGTVFHRGAPAIQTSSKVGVIQIGGERGWQIEVRPKFGDLSTFSLLQGLWALSAPLDVSEDPETPPMVAAESVHDFFVSWALRYIVRFLDRAMRREYRRHGETLEARVRGRIDYSDWSKHWMRGRPFAIPCEHFVFDVDTIQNRIVRAGLEAIERYLVEFRPRDHVRQLTCRAALARLGSVRSCDIRPDVLRSLRYDHLTSRYQAVHAICARLLDNRGLGHRGDAAGTPFVSFGFDLARAFQDLLLILLRRVASEKVREEPRFYYEWLGASRPGAARPHLKPDYLLASSRDVLDAKYKDVLISTEVDSASRDQDALTFEDLQLRISRDDVYQALAYTAHGKLRARRVTFVFPVCRGDASRFPRIFPLHGFSTAAAVRIGIIHLGAVNLKVADRIKLWEAQVQRLLAL